METRQIEFWAKTTEDGRPGISVRDHCLNVGCVAEALSAELADCLHPLFLPSLVVLAAGHDVGKLTVGFLKKCPQWLAANNLTERIIQAGWQFSESNHAAVSQDFFFECLPKKSRHWATAVGGHHGRFLGKGRAAGNEVESSWMKAEREKLFCNLVAQFGSPPEIPPSSETHLLLVAGWITVADWIGSNERFFPLLTQYSPEVSRARAQAALEQIRWGKGRLRAGLSFDELFLSGNLTGFEPNPLQRLCLKSIREPGLYLIEGPMGCGKTEAALSVAYQLISTGRNSGIYFALPTQLTSNRIHERVQDFLRQSLAEETDHPLAHSNSWLHRNLEIHLRPACREADDKENSAEHVAEGRSWFASSRQALLAEYGVGTIDQALLGAVAAKYCAVRLFGLAGKVVILDEVHSYDAYTGSVMDKLIERLLEAKCTVIVLSATLTARRRAQLLGLAGAHSVKEPDGYPLLSGVTRTGESLFAAPPLENSLGGRNVTVRCCSNTGLELLEQLCKKADEGACVLLIKNTVAGAQDACCALKSVRCEGGPEIGLLHSRFPQFRRDEAESIWMDRLGRETDDRPRGCVLVATQVVEQSVDIDADLLVSDLAPTDMLLQRIGRLWRHPRRDRPLQRPEVWVLCPEVSADAGVKEIKTALGKSARVYAPYFLLRSLEVWQRTVAINLPTDIRPLLEATYEERDENCEAEGWVHFRRELRKQIEKMQNLAFTRSNILDNVLLKDEEGIQTRWNGFPSANLVLLIRPPVSNGGETELCFLNGETAAASPFEWRFPVAAAIHRNAVRLPLYAIKRALQTEAQPDWLRLHSKGAAVIGVWDSATGSIALPGGEQNFALSYDENLGVKIERIAPTPSTRQEEDDESWL